MKPDTFPPTAESNFSIFFAVYFIVLCVGLLKIRKLSKKVHSLESNLTSFSYHQNNRPGHQEVNELDFYAGIIDIPNLRSLKEGWKISIKDWSEYQRLAQHTGTLFSVVGNYSKGKTFLIELLTGMRTPHGFKHERSKG